MSRNLLRYGRNYAGIFKNGIFSLSANVFYDIVNKPDVVSVDGDAIVPSASGDFVTDGTIPIFAWRRNANIIIKGKTVIAFMKMWDNGVLIRDFIPVRFTNSNGQSEGAMYDKVSRQLFRNAGTGQFVIGPDVGGGWTNPYVTDGLISMWDGEWNSGKGRHDSNAVVWKDLIGERDASLSGSYEWKDNCWSVSSVTGKGLATWTGENLPADQTIEFVIWPKQTTAYGRVIAEAGYIPSPIIPSDNTYLYIYGYELDRGAYIHGYDNRNIHLHTITHPSGGPLKYYIDGSLKWKIMTSGNNTGTTGYFVNRPSFDRGLDAEYYCVRFYDRVLNDEEISSNYMIDARRFSIAS